MRAVIADTGPIHYLVLIGHAEILVALFGKVIIPSAVRDELARAETPEAVRNWIQTPPVWLEVQTPPQAAFDPSLENLDDRAAVGVARNQGFRVAGTLRVLDLGARRGLLDVADVFERIKRTNFRYRQATMDALLSERSDAQ